MYLRVAERVFSMTTMEMHDAGVRGKGILFAEIGYALTRWNQSTVKMMNHLLELVLCWVYSRFRSYIRSLEKILLVNMSIEDWIVGRCENILDDVISKCGVFVLHVFHDVLMTKKRNEHSKKYLWDSGKENTEYEI